MQNGVNIFQFFQQPIMLSPLCSELAMELRGETTLICLHKIIQVYGGSKEKR